MGEFEMTTGPQPALGQEVEKNEQETIWFDDVGVYGGGGGMQG
jgi:hypothetical protein